MRSEATMFWHTEIIDPIMQKTIEVILTPTYNHALTALQKRILHMMDNGFQAMSPEDMEFNDMIIEDIRNMMAEWRYLEQKKTLPVQEVHNILGFIALIKENN